MLFRCPVAACKLTHCCETIDQLYSHFFAEHTAANKNLAKNDWLTAFEEFQSEYAKIIDRVSAIVKPNGAWKDRVIQNKAKTLDSFLSAAAEFVDNEGKKRRKYRSTPMTAYTFVLLDDTRLHNVKKKVNFYEFLSAVIYVGKASAGRPFDHVKDAKKHSEQGAELSRKETYLKALSDLSEGIQIADCGDRYGYSSEAFARESAMLDILPISILANERRGHTWKHLISSLQEAGAQFTGDDNYNPGSEEEAKLLVGILALLRKYRVWSENRKTVFNFHNVDYEKIE